MEPLARAAVVDTPVPGAEGPRGAGLNPDCTPAMSPSHPHGSACPPLSLLAPLGSHSPQGPRLGQDTERPSAEPCAGRVSGILYGAMTMELGGSVAIECQKNNFRAELEFKLKVALAAAPQPLGGPWGCGA